MLPAREFPLDEAGPRAVPQPLARAVRRRSVQEAPLQGRLERRSGGRHRVLPAAVLRVGGDAVRLPARAAATLALHRDVRGAIAGVLARRHTRATSCWAATPTGRCCRRRSCSCRPRSSSSRAQAFPRDRPARRPTRRKPASRSSAQPLPPVAVDRRAHDPLAALKRFLDTLGPARAGRRRVAGPARDHAALLRRVRPQACRRARASRNSSAAPTLLHRRVARSPTASSCRPRAGRSSPRPSSTPAWCAGAAAPRRSAARSRACCATCPSSRSATRWCTSSTASAATWASSASTSAKARREFLLLEYEGGDKLYVPVSQLGVIGRYSGAQPEEAPLHKLGSGQWDKAKARAAKQVRDTAAELLALYARRAARLGHAFRHQPARPRGVRRRLRLRGDARPGRRDRGGDRRHGGRQADGPPGVRRRRLRQDRGRAARRVRRGRRQQAGGDPLPHHAARRAALPDLLRPLRRLAGEDRRAVALPQPEGNRRDAAQAGKRRDRHRHRHAQAARRRTSSSSASAW